MSFEPEVRVRTRANVALLPPLACVEILKHTAVSLQLFILPGCGQHENTLAARPIKHLTACGGWIIINKEVTSLLLIMTEITLTQTQAVAL